MEEIYYLSRATGKGVGECRSDLLRLGINCYSLIKFYSFAAREPSEKECEIINKFGIEKCVALLKQTTIHARTVVSYSNKKQ